MLKRIIPALVAVAALAIPAAALADTGGNQCMEHPEKPYCGTGSTPAFEQIPGNADHPNGGFNIYVNDNIVATIWNGNDGAQGGTGAPGADGSDGADGADGSNGTNGSTPSFVQTDDGFDIILDGKIVGHIHNGVVGVDGAKGDTGAQGPQGETGAAGPDGRDGVDGVDGTNGVDGKDGANGVSGKDGRDGVTTVVTEIRTVYVAGSQGSSPQGGVLGASATNNVCIGSRTVRSLLPKSMRHLKSVRAMVGGKTVRLSVKHGRLTVKFAHKRCGLYAVVIRHGHQRFERLYTVGKAGNVTGYNVALVHS